MNATPLAFDLARRHQAALLAAARAALLVLTVLVLVAVLFALGADSALAGRNPPR